jgi:hypothetical protein
MNVSTIYHGSDGEATKLLYETLATLPNGRAMHGLIAMNLLRAQKASARAKVYRGGVRGQGSYKGMAYAKKNWSLAQLCDALIKAESLPVNARACTPENIDYWRRWSASARRVRELFVSESDMTAANARQLLDTRAEPPPFTSTWGWREDAGQEFHKWVLYVELPTGQVSFHSAAPLTAHRYASEWDGAGFSETRIIAYAQAVLDGRRPTLLHPPTPPPKITSEQQMALFG